ncbi:MAG: hypothetical protein ABSF00_01955 [Candidatus Bathyarchaeia archaeon]|jgi:hypothetical protein
MTNPNLKPPETYRKKPVKVTSAECVECHATFTPRFKVLIYEPIFCDACISRLVILGVKAMLDRRGKITHYEQVASKKEEPIMEAAVYV